jgi:type IV secretory pathway VirB2 component (pilin)
LRDVVTTSQSQVEDMQMNFRKLSSRVLEPTSMFLMILGIVALCQPWIEVLHRYGVTITLVGLIGFSVFSKIKPMPKEGR